MNGRILLRRNGYHMRIHNGNMEIVRESDGEIVATDPNKTASDRIMREWFTLTNKKGVKA